MNELYRIEKQRGRSVKILLVFLTILVVGLLSSSVPFGIVGVYFGSPAVLINSILLTLLYFIDRR